MPRTGPLLRLLVWVRQGNKAIGGARLVSHPLCKVITNENKQHHSILPTFKAACPLAGNREEEGGGGHRFKKGERRELFSINT